MVGAGFTSGVGDWVTVVGTVGHRWTKEGVAGSRRKEGEPRKRSERRTGVRVQLTAPGSGTGGTAQEEDGEGEDTVHGIQGQEPEGCVSEGGGPESKLPSQI